MGNQYLTIASNGYRLSKGISSRISAAASGSQVVSTDANGYVDASFLANPSKINFSSAAPATTAGSIWWEVDGNGYPLKDFFWVWDTAFTAWRSPLKEVFFNFRNDIDASIATGYLRHYIKTIDWWIYPSDSHGAVGQANQIAMIDQGGAGSAKIATIPLTSTTNYSGGRLTNVNIDFTTSSYLIETRFSKDGYANGIYVYGGIRAYYYLFR